MVKYSNCIREREREGSIESVSEECQHLLRHPPTGDYSEIDVTSLELDSDAIMEAVAWYVDKHMQYLSDPEDTVENACDTEDDLHIQSARYTIEESGSRSGCAKDYCGDCEDHAILRNALMRVLGIPWSCAFCADHYAGYWGGGHTFNIVNYQNKWRIMDYGPLGSQFLTEWSSHQPHNIWNDEYGLIYCPDWVDNLGDGYLDCGCDKTYPSSYTWNYKEGTRCPESFSGYWTYRTDTCP